MRHLRFLLAPLFIISAVPLPATTLAERLAAAKWTHYAPAPGYSEGPTWLNGEVYFCSGALLKVTAAGKVFPWLDLNPAGTFLQIGRAHV